MKRIIALSLCLLVTIEGQCQKSKDTLIRYFNEDLQPVRKKEAVFVGILIKDQMGWNTLIYDDSTRILARGRFADTDCKIKDGWFVFYYSDGKRASGGRFERNVRVDIWKSWYPNGQVKDSFNYVNNNPEGGAKSYHESGVLAAEGSLKNGTLDGPWTFYHENSNPSTKEVYKDGKLADLECFDTTGMTTGFNCAISRPPALVGKYGGLEKYFRDSTRFPKNEMKEPIEGYVTVEFTITKEGKLANYRVISSQDSALTKETTRLIYSIQNWYPAVSHNRLVDFPMILNIPFFAYDPGKKIERFIQPFDQY